MTRLDIANSTEAHGLQSVGFFADARIHVMSLEQRRTNYMLGELTEGRVLPDAVAQFRAWLDDALHAGLLEPTAMTLATATAEGRPAARVVLLKGVEDEGFAFYTSYASRKGRELAANPHAALVFFWDKLQRQVRVEGVVAKLSRDKSRAYFQARPRGSQISAAASAQSSVVPDRKTLMDEAARLQAAYADQDVPLPPAWGGYLLRPSVIEFWQGRPDRLHDRLRYTRQPDNAWRIERLAP